MKLLIKEVENQVTNREQHIRYQREESDRILIRIKEDEESLKNLKAELEDLKALQTSK